MKIKFGTHGLYFLYGWVVQEKGLQPAALEPNAALPPLQRCHGASIIFFFY